MTAADGASLTVRDLGGDGPVVLLVHATSFHGAVWAPLAAGLPAARVVAPDLRAHGASARPDDGDLRWERFADDVLAVVDAVADALGGAPVRAAGHSMGGAALLLAEQRRPGTFAALHLYEPVAYPPGFDGTAAASALAQGARRRRHRFESRQEAFDHYAAKRPLADLDPEVLRAYVDHGFEPDPSGGGVVLRCRPEDEAETYGRGTTHEAFARLGEVTCPVVVARGSLAVPGPATVAEEIARALPAGRLEVHDDLGHFGPLEQPARLAAAVGRALGVHEAGTPPA